MAMSKKDVVPFALLLGLLLAWPYIDRHIILKYFPQEAPVRPAVTEPAVGPEESELTSAPVESPAVSPVESQASAAAVEDTADLPPARAATLSNDLVDVVLTSRGGSVQQATLKEFARALKSKDPVLLDFGGMTALAYEQLAGLGSDRDFALETVSGRSVVFSRTAPNGLSLRRTMTLTDRYVVEVVDILANTGATELTLPAHSVRTGPMRREVGHKDKAGVVTLGVDTLSPGGEKVQHWGNRIAKLFTAEMEDSGKPGLPVNLDVAPNDRPVDWVAAKNKYFVQIITPAEGAESSKIKARRALDPREIAGGPAPRKITEIEEVAASAVFAGQTLASGEKIERRFKYYVGPKKYSELSAAALHQVDVMEFGDWIKPISKLLLRVLNFLHDYLPFHNYGIAIILLTIIVRVIFWPVTRKSTESMKRMQQVAPLVNALREKYKDNPTKQQQEIMALYKEHKVNPLGGCLPMLIQIPVFFALFTVLRSAIELRFADFLWIQDLSEPENLFAGMIPFVGSLNLLPLLMSGTMFLQMKLSPSSGDPAQQKMMAVMMPIMMLFFLYSFAAGLALYWTTQNVLMIVQQLMMKRKNAATTVPVKA